MCMFGFYRWSINAFSFLRNVTVQYGKPVAAFDEPDISVGWVGAVSPNRVAIVGESLFVHLQVRISSLGSAMRFDFKNRFVVGCGHHTTASWNNVASPWDVNSKASSVQCNPLFFSASFRRALSPAQFTKQRNSKPDFGLREDILLPWYTELARQYTATPYGTPWAGNTTLLTEYESIAWHAGEDRYSRSVHTRWGHV